jgi:hypothetical protein
MRKWWEVFGTGALQEQLDDFRRSPALNALMNFLRAPD